MQIEILRMTSLRMMPGKSRTEIACSLVLSWFRNWDDNQKIEFAQILPFAQILIDKQIGSPSTTDQSLDALMSTMTNLSLDSAKNEGPGIFECQLKIFSKWYDGWNPGERSEFAVQINSVSPEFIAYVNVQLK